MLLCNIGGGGVAPIEDDMSIWYAVATCSSRTTLAHHLTWCLQELLNFQATTWERCPRVYRGKKSTSRSDYFRDLCDLAAFQHHVEGV
jgi:hypothetical protein